MSYFLCILLLLGRFLQSICAINTDNQICGYNGDTFLCCSGYKKDDQGECTQPICEHGCGHEGECIKPNTCYCSNGETAPSCLDGSPRYNENLDKKKETPGLCNNNCNGQGVCLDGKCKCLVGYSGNSCLKKLVDQCYLTLSRGICQKPVHQIKLNIELCCSAFQIAWGDPCQKCPKSRCQKGFMEIDGICRDVNECTIPELCKNGKCENLEGSFRCKCLTGYQFDPRIGDCIKIKDPCEHLPKVCGDGMKCLTLPMGKYKCQCIEGYSRSADQKSCKSKLKKQNTFNFCRVYGTLVCQYGKCIPNGNNYKCQCNPGYIKSGDQKSCKKNIDYCALYQTALCQNGICVSIGNDYICKCNKGYTLSFNKKKCTSVCDYYPTSLCQNAKCIPHQNGSYECQCNEGYLATGKGKECRRIMNDQSELESNKALKERSQSSYDIDFCSYDYYKKQCLGGRCINKKNYYHCECLRGYTSDKNGFACKEMEVPVSDHMLDMAASTDIKSYCDEYGSFLCVNGHCIESGSSYQCHCNKGFKESIDGKSCYDIDECVLDSNICVQGTCTNSPGSYQCSCYDGFTIHYLPGGPKCYDRNECEEYKSLCINGQCINKWGTYSCSCNPGYTISNNKKQCVPQQVLADSKNALPEGQCKYCSGLCQKVNSTYSKCECPTGLGPVLNTGLCAPIMHVADIQFDVPTSVIFGERNVTENSSYIFFRLVSGVNKINFVKQISSRYRKTVINQCRPIKESIRDGILCSFSNNSN